MNRPITSALAVLTPIFLYTGIASAGISDMYITTNHGAIFSVDGDTLQATQVAQLDDANTINDIQHVGNGRFIANLTFAMASFDLYTQTQETLFTTQDLFGTPDTFAFAGGLSRRNNGDLYFGVSTVGSPDESEQFGISYDTLSNSVFRLADVPGGLNIDYYELSNGTMLLANTNDQSITLFDPIEGGTVASYSLDVTAVSFVQSHDTLYILTRPGDLYSLDISNGSTEFFGSITGVNAPFSGASIADSNAILIPSPSTLWLGAVGLTIGFRRRR